MLIPLKYSFSYNWWLGRLEFLYCLWCVHGVLGSFTNGSYSGGSGLHYMVVVIEKNQIVLMGYESEQRKCEYHSH